MPQSEERYPEDRPFAEPVRYDTHDAQQCQTGRNGQRQPVSHHEAAQFSARRTQALAGE